MAKFTRGRQRDILGYFYEHPGKDITIAELERAFKGKYVREDIMSTIANVLAKRGVGTVNVPLKKLTQGVWNLVVDSNGEPAQPPTGDGFMVVEIIKERDTYLLVEDSGDGKIYKMILVD